MNATDDSLSPEDFENQPMQLDQQVFQRLKKLGYEPRIVFDIGASNSVWSFYMKKVLPDAKFYLFEPLIDYYRTEHQEFISNNFRDYPDFQLHSIALGETSGETIINVFPNNLWGSTGLKIEGTGVEIIPVPVKMLTLDEAIESLHLPLPQVIKIDTQGCELSILKGARDTLRTVDMLILECWFYRGYGKRTPLLNEIIDWLLPFNFRLWDVADCYRNEEGIMGTLDCVFVNTRANIAPDWFYA